MTNDQARHIYKKVELEDAVNINAMKLEIEEDKLGKDDIDNDEIYPYHKVIIDNINKENIITSQMEQWSILSNVVYYVQYDRNSKNFYNIGIKTIDPKSHRKIDDRLKEKDRHILELDFGNIPEKLRGEYLDVYERVQSEVISTTRFDENSDLSMTYLGRIDMTRASKIKAEEKFPISEQGYMVEKLLDGMECQILLDTGAGKTCMSKSCYLRCKSLHSLPKFASKTQRDQVGNGQYVSVLFIIPIVIDIHSHRYKIVTLVSEIHENVDLVLGIKYIFELEGIINSQKSCFSFLNMSIPFFPKEQLILKPIEQ